MPVEAPAPRRSYALLLARLLLLALILAVAAVFRFNGLNWDDGRLLHPDERHITDVITARIHAPDRDDLRRLLDPVRSPLNPRSAEDAAPGQQPRQRQFAYGSLPLFVTDFAAWAWGWLRAESWNGFFKVFRVGRVLSVLFDLATVALVYAIGRRSYGTAAGLLAAAFMALAVMPIQLAHFFVTDTWLTTFVTAALFAALVGAGRGRALTFALAGFFVGCAVATKGTAALLAFPVAVALYLAATTPFRGWRATARRFVGLGTTTAAAALVALLLFEPYALLDPWTYLRDLGEQSAIIGGKLDAPYTRQFIGTLPLIYQGKNLLGWGLGPLLGTAALCGTVAAGWRAWRRASRADIILLSWVVPYTLLIASYEAKFTRYLLPLLPPLVLFAGALLGQLGAFGWSGWRRRGSVLSADGASTGRAYSDGVARRSWSAWAASCTGRADSRRRARPGARLLRDLRTAAHAPGSLSLDVR
jgi:hypothetical protein